LGGVQSAFPCALMLPQSETERLLEHHLGGLGVTVERRTEATSFISSSRGVISRLRRPDGTEEAVDTEWLIGCDGAHSMVRHGLGLPFTGDTLQSDWVLADVHLKGYPFPASELVTYWHTDGVLVIFPISPGRFRVIADVDFTSAPSAAAPSLEQVQALINRRATAAITASEPIWLTGFRINERKVADYRVERVFLAGDAAHVHSPAGGQGMNTGMQDAFNLAWKLALVCHERCAEPILDSYSGERSGVGEHVLRNAGSLTRVATMKNPLAQAARNFIGHALFGLTWVERAMANSMAEITIGYRHSPLNGPSLNGIGHAAGERFAPVSGEAAVGAGGSPRFVLYSSHHDEAQQLIAMYSDILEPEVRTPPDERGTWLVRPDGYVAAVTAAEDLGMLDDYLIGLVQGGKSPII
jgi:2-polyprenyl-6-methoxyphenol hydroxylase-like FAD-dependent oxidoreductase